MLKTENYEIIYYTSHPADTSRIIFLRRLPCRMVFRKGHGPLHNLGGIQHSPQTSLGLCLHWHEISLRADILPSGGYIPHGVRAPSITAPSRFPRRGPIFIPHSRSNIICRLPCWMVFRKGQPYHTGIRPSVCNGPCPFRRPSGIISTPKNVQKPHGNSSPLSSNP